MANDFENRITKLETDHRDIRELTHIIYGFVDEIRGWTLELREEHKEFRKRFDQNEALIASLAKTQATLVETQGILIQMVERIDRKLDDLGRQGTNGHSKD